MRRFGAVDQVVDPRAVGQRTASQVAQGVVGVRGGLAGGGVGLGLQLAVGGVGVGVGAVGEEAVLGVVGAGDGAAGPVWVSRLPLAS